VAHLPKNSKNLLCQPPALLATPMHAGRSSELMTAGARCSRRMTGVNTRGLAMASRSVEYHEGPRKMGVGTARGGSSGCKQWVIPVLDLKSILKNARLSHGSGRLARTGSQSADAFGKRRLPPTV